ncbi:MAG: excinuclease ABC subunit UvrA [Planctomycetes bacterium]|nr:excinuclease ABC subunit UvrA [Planctomycetota bacterium]
MEPDHIEVKGAKIHNLKNVHVKIPKKQLVIFSGVSGSGKSSLAFDTIYAEGQRRYVESLSSYARQFLGQMEKPPYDYIRGLSPTISIEQKAASRNPRSTVGTITEINDYMRVLFARVGTQSCYKCGKPVGEQSSDKIAEEVLCLPTGTDFMVLAPLVENRKGTFKDIFKELQAEGFTRVRVNGDVMRISEVNLHKKLKHTIDIVIDRLTMKNENERRIRDSIELALKRGEGVCIIAPDESDDLIFSEKNSCASCKISFPELSPQSFSFNSPHGMCATCDGLGVKLEVDLKSVVVDESASISDGAIPFLSYVDWSGGGGTGSSFKHVCSGYDIDTSVPFEKLPREKQRLILYGTRKDSDPEGSGGYFGAYKAGKLPGFEGVIPIIERRFKETTSEAAKRYYGAFFSWLPCPECHGTRLRRESSSVLVGGVSFTKLSAMTIREAYDVLQNTNLRGSRKAIAEELMKEIQNRLGFLLGVGLDYLSLDRAGPTLSGGESQRIRLASQIGSELTGVTYILDEPSIGLHQRDNKKLLATLKHLRDIGNSVIVVEHDRETLEEADYIIDFGPGAGTHGGAVVFEGTPAEIRKSKTSVTGLFLADADKIETPNTTRDTKHGYIAIRGATENNLKNVDAVFPLGVFTCVTGVSGAGKSSLINAILFPALSRHLHRSTQNVGAHKKIEGLKMVDKVIDIDQSPIGRTPRSNPATYTKVFDLIRDLFASTKESKAWGYNAGRFSFNVKGGRCEACQGAGVIQVEMHFLADVFVQCEVCRGLRFNQGTLKVKYKGANISDVLNMTVKEAHELFEPVPKIRFILQTLIDVGLDYIQLGQSSTTLSGGEAQRIKLSRELSKVGTGRTVYILDEPTTGLHFADIKKLLSVLNRLVQAGNTVIVIEHNLDVIKTADWIIDLGPEGGHRGGLVIAEGTPRQVAKAKESYTGQFLAEIFDSGTRIEGRGASRGSATVSEASCRDSQKPHLSSSSLGGKAKPTKKSPAKKKTTKKAKSKSKA